uniref:Uncharacterized protein n=1 Tax=viral metagenome TaxID=1070528 RepID=A0A6M3LSR7_9ZZZZ
MSRALDRKKLSDPEVEEMAKERPYVLQQIQMQILYDIAGLQESTHDLIEELVERTTRFHGSWEETIPVGKFKPLTIPVTDSITELSPLNVSTMPWMAFTIYNDGPDPVFMMVNEEFIQDVTPLNVGENVTVDMKKRQIVKIFLHCALGLTTSVRIFALR